MFSYYVNQFSCPRLFLLTKRKQNHTFGQNGTSRQVTASYAYLKQDITLFQIWLSFGLPGHRSSYTGCVACSTHLFLKGFKMIGLPLTMSQFHFLIVLHETSFLGHLTVEIPRAKASRQFLYSKHTNP